MNILRDGMVEFSVYGSDIMVIIRGEIDSGSLSVFADISRYQQRIISSSRLPVMGCVPFWSAVTATVPRRLPVSDEDPRHCASLDNKVLHTYILRIYFGHCK